MRQYSDGEWANRQLVEEMYQQVLNPLDASCVDTYIAENYIQHSPLAKTGAAGLKEFLHWAKANSPAATHAVKRILVDGDFVVAHVHVIINPGEQGNNVIDIFRIADGKIVEHWDAMQALPDSSENNNGIF